jgi:hypothetical protein
MPGKSPPPTGELVSKMPTVSPHYSSGTECREELYGESRKIPEVLRNYSRSSDLSTYIGNNSRYGWRFSLILQFIVISALISRLSVPGWLALGLAACSQAPAPPPAASRFVDTPPVERLTPDQLHDLAKRCDRYPPEGPARGPYDAKYCEAALAAWSDSPIQMLRLPAQPASSR